MKKKFSVYLKVLLTCVCLAVVLFGVFGISVGISISPTNEAPQNIPYYNSEAPEEYGLLVNFDLGSSVFFGFDLNAEKTSVILLPNAATVNDVMAFGYEVNDVSNASYDFLAKLIDRFGGIELNSLTDGRLKYTGVQITEMLSQTNDAEFRCRVIERLFENIKQQGINSDDMLFLIENTETTLNYPNSYYLPETVEKAINNIIFIN